MKEQYKKAVEVANYKKNNPTKCWDCRKADASDCCPWANRFKPVLGWIAEPTMIYFNVQHGAKVVKKPCPSFIVKYCPLFEPDPKRDQLEIDAKLTQWHLAYGTECEQEAEEEL